MRTFRELLIRLQPCSDGLDWVENKTIDQAIREVERGDWVIWLAYKLGLPQHNIKYAESQCLKTIETLFRDELSFQCMQVVERYGIIGGKGDLNKSEIQLMNHKMVYVIAAIDSYADQAAFNSTLFTEQLENVPELVANAKAKAAYNHYHSTEVIRLIDTLEPGKPDLVTNELAKARYNQARLESQRETSIICKTILANTIIHKVNQILTA